MDFNKVHYMMMVAEFKSFSKAAEKCFISQPALTRCIKNMEEELGVKLFDRILFTHPIDLCRGAISGGNEKNLVHESQAGSRDGGDRGR